MSSEPINPINVEKIKPDLMVHAKIEGSARSKAEVHVGTVDYMEGNRWIKLKKDDSEDGLHHWIPLEWVARTDHKAIYLNKSLEEFRLGALSENPAPLH